MRYLSVCSGIEAASAAWHSLGWQPVAFSEIEPFPCSVLAHHFPNVPNFGDMNNFEEWDIEPGSVDVLVGGTPCQSFSIAGLRGGLKDGRGNLALTYCRIVQKLQPKWFVWENVPGVLSSNSGRDFGSIVGAMAELGYGIAYRVLDAQYFGVPQRRRRVFVVGCAGDWRRAAAVLFEFGCVSGDSQASRKKKSNVAALTATGVGTCGADDNQGQAGHVIASPITSRPYGDRGAGEDRLVTGFQASQSGVRLLDTHATLDANMGRQDYETETMVVAFSGRNRGDDGRGYDRPPNVTGEIAGTVDTVKPGNVAGPTIGVRRLTPRECERLQGFPDDWTLVPHRGKPAADGPRYKAIGNSMAVPVMRWIGKRIEEQA
jgi:DNA (cytosine-5)-methyltransferase 1